MASWCFNLIFALSYSTIALRPFVESLDPIFVSIDCGGTSSYADQSGIQWVGDSDLIRTGKIGSVQKSASTTHRPWLYLRYFPTGKKNCYSVSGIPTGSKTLVRAMFYYGNYDSLSSPPSFDLHFDGNYWDRVETVLDAAKMVEMVYVTKFEKISICVARTRDDSVPFISTMEFRVLPPPMYGFSDPARTLATVTRLAFGSPDSFRYPDDRHDRIWFSYVFGRTQTNVTSYFQSFNVSIADDPPPAALKHAITPLDSTANTMDIPIYYLPTKPDVYAVNLYFSEVRATNYYPRYIWVVLDGVAHYPGALFPPYGSVIEFSGSNFSLSSNSRFQLTKSYYYYYYPPPILNAMEIFRVGPILVNGTNAQDVSGLKVLQDRFRQLQIWTGYPCLPIGFNWEWINCSADAPPRVTVLYLNGAGLNSSLPNFSALDALQIIDLSNNSLTGEIPEFLGLFPNLKELNLADNCFSGGLPISLVHNTNLQLNVSDSNSCRQLAHSHSYARTNKKLIAGVSVGVGAFFLVLLYGWILFIIRQRRRRHSQPPPQPTSAVSSSNVSEDQQMMPSLQSELYHAFSYAEIAEITNNFRNLIDKGSSGAVYYGRLKNDTEVAVKVLSDSHRGNAEFVREVRLLMKIHHKNLAPFVGFCEEGRNMMVLYEYMTNGNLGEVLSGRKSISEPLTWKKRLEIALDVATGLEYLHAGCQDTIIHRDVKPANILLNERLQAKLADFGISKVGDHGTQASIAGTPGYIDPEISETGIATTRSDVYSFGVVLFDLICGQFPRFDENDQLVPIVVWATSKIGATRNATSLVDPWLEGQFHSPSGIWKVAELAVACTAKQSARRPDVHDVLYVLKEALEMEICKTAASSNTGATPSYPMNFSIEPTRYSIYPSPR